MGAAPSSSGIMAPMRRGHGSHRSAQEPESARPAHPLEAALGDLGRVGARCRRVPRRRGHRSRRESAFRRAGQVGGMEEIDTHEPAGCRRTTRPLSPLHLDRHRRLPRDLAVGPPSGPRERSSHSCRSASRARKSRRPAPLKDQGARRGRAASGSTYGRPPGRRRRPIPCQRKVAPGTRLSSCRLRVKKPWCRVEPPRRGGSDRGSDRHQAAAGQAGTTGNTVGETEGLQWKMSRLRTWGSA